MRVIRIRPEKNAKLHAGEVVVGDKANHSTLQDMIMTPGVAVPSGADMVTYTTPGVYYCTTGSTVATLQNCPTTSPFRLEVTYSSSPIRMLQKYILSVGDTIIYQSILHGAVESTSTYRRTSV